MLKLGYDSSNAYDITPVINGAYIAAACAVMVITGMTVGWIKDTLNYASAGKVACAKQFQKEYFDRCNPRWDGVACTLEARSDLEDYHAGIALACALTGPLDPMVINWGPSSPSLKPDSVGERQIAGM